MDAQRPYLRWKQTLTPVANNLKNILTLYKRK